MAVGPAAAPFAALAQTGAGRAVSTGGTAPRSAITMPTGSLVSYGDVGDDVVAVQRIVGVDDDGIFGPITPRAVERFQQRAGLPVTGAVDARTWTTLFKSNVSVVSGRGKTTMTVYQSTGGVAAPDAKPAPVTRKKASSAPIKVKTPATSTDPATNRAATAKPQSTSTDPATDRAATAKPQSTSTDPATNRAATAKPQSTTTPVAAPVASGGCGSGRIATPVSGPVTGVYGESRPGHMHAGQDIAAPAGTAVRAAQCGTVTQAGYNNGGYRHPPCLHHPNRGRTP